MHRAALSIRRAPPAQAFTMTIEAMRPSDLSAVHALLRTSKLPSDGLEAHVATAVVAREDDGVVGSAALEVYPAYALLRSVVIDTTRRGRGLGQLITAEAITLARRHGLTAVYLLTETAPGFFPKLGFVPIARSQVPSPVQQSVEFTGVCCANAQAMMLPLI
jgi:amino-acid N-acetyltransferase